jgi:hypothetical protein
MPDSGSTQTIEPSTAERRATGRSIWVVVCVVLAVLLTTPGLVAFWGQRTPKRVLSCEDCLSARRHASSQDSAPAKEAVC